MKLFLALLGGFFCVPGFGQLFYRITPPGGKPSHLIGTMHLVPEDRMRFAPAVTAALEASEVFVMEINPDIPVSEQLALAGKVIMNPPLQERIAPERYTALRAEAEALGVKGRKFDRYARLKPLFLVPAVVQAALDGTEGVDLVLHKKAVKRHLPVYGLETAAFQINLLAGIPDDQQLSMLDGPDPFGIADFNRMVDLYFAENLAELQRLTAEEMKEFPELNRKLLEDRNRAWIPEMQRYSTLLSTFYAVGAAHLPGPEGVLELLEQAGWTVEALPGAFVP